MVNLPPLGYFLVAFIAVGFVANRILVASAVQCLSSAEKLTLVDASSSGRKWLPLYMLPLFLPFFWPSIWSFVFLFMVLVGGSAANWVWARQKGFSKPYLMRLGWAVAVLAISFTGALGVLAYLLR